MKTKKTIGQRMLDGLYSVIPVVQDPAREWVRKLAFLMALLVFVGAGYFLLDEVWWHPARMNATADTLRDWYHTEGDAETDLPAEGDTTVYPDGMDPAFKNLYRTNSDVRAWLTFTAGSDGADLFEGAIDNPVVQTTDNDYYLTRDFWGEYDKAGTLYFDYRNDLNAGAVNRNLIIFGHNIKSGLMFSRFNLLVTGNLMRARKLTTLELNTLYDQRTYKVFAVGVFNVDEEEGPVFNYLRTKFGSEEDFLKFVSDIRRRSLFTFGDVDVQEGDEILTLSSCTNKRESHLNNGRVVVFARRVREGEDPTVDTTKTVSNEEVLMPMAWYVNQGLTVPNEYSSLPTATTTTVTTTNVVGTIPTTTTSTVTATSTRTTAATSATTSVGTTAPTTAATTVPTTVTTTTTTTTPTAAPTTTTTAVTTTTTTTTTVTTTATTTATTTETTAAPTAVE